MKIAIFVQARITSKRFPKKIFEKINGKKIIEILIAKLKKIKHIDKIIFLIPDTNRNKDLSKLLKKLNIEVFEGNENNVLERYYLAAKKYNVKNIIRITSDCPLIDIKLSQKIIKKFLSGDYNYVSNIDPPTFPDGMDIEIFKFKTLEQAWKNSKTKAEKEHVTVYMKKNEKKKFNIRNNNDLSKIRITLDYKKDLILLRKIFNYFKPDIYFGLNEIINLKNKKPKWFNINKEFV
jgi:spore coat polysaccharide biosynthesis protein SpsF (cytidylyltransferase family)